MRRRSPDGPRPAPGGEPRRWGVCHSRRVARARLGVALLVPAPVAAEVDGLRRAAGDGALGRIPAHLTLVPPVNVAEGRLPDVLAALRAAAAATRPFRVALGPLATFWPDAPVLYLAVSGDAPAVAALRERAFVAPLARPLTWPFVPHVTVAGEASPERIAAAVAALADYRAEVAFDRVHLLQEEPGRRWAPIADFAFAPPATVGRGSLPLVLTRSERLDPEAAAFAAAAWAQEGSPGRAPVALTARRDDGRVVGVARGHLDAGTAHLGELVVDPAERGLGVGSHLLAAFTSLAAERGCTRLTVRTEAGGRAEAFYRARGWADDLRLARWRRGRDFVQLRRTIAP